MGIFKQGLAEEVWADTYKWETDQNVMDTFRRVAKDIASNEKDPVFWEEEYFKILKTFSYVPGGRIISNAGTGLKGTSYVNCFVSGFEGENQDSIEGIYTELKRQAKILKSEGGYGFCVSALRPRGAYIKGIGVESPGAVKMLDLWDTSSAVITSGNLEKKKKKAKGKGKIRKGAMMVVYHCSGPDIEDFVKAKQEPGKLTKFNMSVLITDDFMDCIKNNKPWNLEFPVTEHPQYNKEWDGDLQAWKKKGYPVNIWKTYEDANELWDLITKSTFDKSEPGVIFIDRINQLSNLSYCEKINSTNPCLVGETLVAVADGRGHISIEQLAEEGKDIPVYCLDNEGKACIRYMREPRITGYNQPIYKITLDDGNIVRATGNHKLRLNSGEYVELLQLKVGDSLKIMNSYKRKMYNKKESSFYPYKQLEGSQPFFEHRQIAAFFNNCDIPRGYVVHHKDFNSSNNSPENLEIMTRVDHDKLHGEAIKGDANPKVRAQTEWSNGKWANYRAKMSKSTSGLRNGKSLGYTNEDLKDIALEFTKELGRRFSTKEWQNYALEKGYPSQFSKWRNNHFGGVCGFSKWAALTLGYENVDSDPRQIKAYQALLEQGYNCEIIDGKINYIKNCELCGEEYKTAVRTTAYCSKGHSAKGGAVTASKNPKNKENRKRIGQENIEKTKKFQTKTYLDLKFKLKRNIEKREWVGECRRRGGPYTLNKNNAFKNFKELKGYAETYNHRILKIELDGCSNVYNGTVDEYHNFFFGGFKQEPKHNRNKHKDLIVDLNSRQCGEQPLGVNSACVLGAINLTQYVNQNNTDFN